MISLGAMAQPLCNWSGNHRYRAGAVHRPESAEQLRAIVARGESLQVLGTRHTFSSIGDAAGLIALDRLPGAREIAIDRAAMTVSVGPAVTYAALAEALNRERLALANLASLPHISVAGAVATASHGSGDGLGNLATSVVGLRLLTSTGEALDCDRGDPRFDGIVVNLGALGVVTRVTLAVEPYYELRQDVFVDLEWDRLFDHLDEILAAGRSVSVFHEFGERAREVWVKAPARAPARGELFGARPATAPRNPVPGGDPGNCTAQLGEPGPWSERLPHFRCGFTPSSGAEIQSELFVARADAGAALRALLGLGELMRSQLLVAELRTIDADELWLSPHYRRDSAALHFTWRRNQREVERIVAAVEDAIAPLAPLPHWGKLFRARAGELAPRYARLEDFRRLRAELDPRDAFANDWLRESLIGVGP